jgi:hypothetical protein
MFDVLRCQLADHLGCLLRRSGDEECVVGSDVGRDDDLVGDSACRRRPTIGLGHDAVRRCLGRFFVRVSASTPLILVGIVAGLSQQVKERVRTLRHAGDLILVDIQDGDNSVRSPGSEIGKAFDMIYL